MHGFPFHLEDVLLFLAIAGAVVPLLRMAGVNSVLAFLALGVVVGPFGLGAFEEQAPWIRFVAIDHVAFAASFSEIGVVLLLFLIGLEVSGPRLMQMRRLVFGLGGAQVLASGAVIGGVAAAFGNAAPAAFVIAGAFALSSTAIVLQLLTESARLGTPAGRACLAVLLMQDLVVVPVLLLVDLLAKDGGESLLRAIGEALGLAVVVVAGIIVLGRRLARPMLRIAAMTKAPEAIAAAALLLIVVIAASTAAAGLSLALGAFLAGLLLAETEYRHEIEATLDPFKGLLLGLFFMSVGMGLDVGQALDNGVWLAPALLGLLTIKAGVLLGLTRAFGLNAAASVETSLVMAPAGEFAFVIVAAAYGAGILGDEITQFMVALAGLSMLLNPGLAVLGRRLARRIETRAGSDHAVEDVYDLRGHVVIVGFGRVGRFLGGVLSEEGMLHLSVDADGGLVADRRREGANVYYGDARKIDLLKKLNLAEAAALAVTMNDHHATEAVVRAARREWPHLPIFVRARDTAHARVLVRAGADRATSEALEAGLDLSETVLAGIGVPDDAARARIDRIRRAELDSMFGKPRSEDAA